MKLKATSQSIFWLQERLQAPAFVDFGNMTFSVIPAGDENDHDDDGGERRIMTDSMQQRDYGDGVHVGRKIRKPKKDKQSAVIYAPKDDLVDQQQNQQQQPHQSQRPLQQPQQVIETVFVPILKHCGGGGNHLWDTMKLPTAGPNSQQPCDWQKLGIGVTVKSSESSTGAIHHFCCSRAAMDKGICHAKKLGRLIVNPKVMKQRNYRQLVVPTTADAAFSWPSNSHKGDNIFATNQTGDYLWILANCWDEGADVLVDGSLEWSSVVGNSSSATTGLGNLVNSIKEGPRSKKPKYPENGYRQFLVFGPLAASYLVICLCFSCFVRRTRRQFTDGLDIARLYVMSVIYFVAFLHLGLTAFDLYVWGARSGNPAFQGKWVWDGPERDEILRHSALLFGSFMTGMARWLVLVQIAIVSTMSSPENESQRKVQRKTRWWVTLFAILYTIICFAWGVVEAMAKDNIKNLKMLKNGEEKGLLKVTAILSACAFFFNGCAFLWAWYRFLKQCCRSEDYLYSFNGKSSFGTLLVVTICGSFLVYTMIESWNQGHKMNALFVWDLGITPIVTEATYYIVLVFFTRGPVPDDNANKFSESDNTANISDGEELSEEVEMTSLLESDGGASESNDSCAAYQD